MPVWSARPDEPAVPEISMSIAADASANLRTPAAITTD
jgi:hypothetical protein